MITSSSAVILGASTGVVMASIIYLVVLGYRKFVRPRYSKFVYRGANISGRWRLDGPATKVWILDFTQHSSEITGTAVLQDAKDLNATQVYDLTGTMEDSLLVLNFLAGNPEGVSAMTALFELDPGGKKMRGGILNFVEKDHEVRTGAITLQRLVDG